ncbi:kinase-like domain-containing protein [Mycotypha africana]|uniref:kinase-like domain-containing protein n=1 Tax=Mycotypha africana TaxID=64632 RepID=UPI0022FFFCE2|nr:kinase-like domain-containing protein [Mycotypha africana]KAI8981767.1 kinase-like domain-containing protein [Mycotypha africana]
MSSATRKQPVTVPCKYKTGKILGNGTYATVKEAMHIETKKFYAVKIISKKLMEGREHMVRNEINILRKVSQGHKNILSLVDYFETMNNLYLVTDLALGGELFDRICQKGSYTEQDAANIIRTVCDAVAYLHDNGVVHRDLKPENLIFRTADEDSDLLIADFGLSRIIDSDKFDVLRTTCGTPGYMAPEIFKRTGHSKPVDMWAIGVITYFLLCGYTPFEGGNSIEEMRAIMEGEYYFHEEYWMEVSDVAKAFIERCLTVNPEERITAHEALQHPWLLSSTHVDKTQQDLLPNVRRNFNARRTFKKAVDLVRLSYQLRHKQMLSQAAQTASSSSSSSSDQPVDASEDAHTAAAAATATEEEVKMAENDIKPVNEGIDQVLKTD